MTYMSELFINKKFYIIDSDDCEIKNILTNHGAVFQTYLSESLSFVVSDNCSVGEVGEAEDIYNVPVVTSEWINLCIQWNEIKYMKIFHPSIRKLLKNMIFYLANIDNDDLVKLKNYILIFGGTIQSNLASNVTHIILGSIEGKTHDEIIKSRPVNCELVNPNWIVQCINYRNLVSTMNYNPINILQNLKKLYITPESVEPAFSQTISTPLVQSSSVGKKPASTVHNTVDNAAVKQWNISGVQIQVPVSLQDQLLTRQLPTNITSTQNYFVSKQTAATQQQQQNNNNLNITTSVNTKILTPTLTNPIMTNEPMKMIATNPNVSNSTTASGTTTTTTKSGKSKAIKHLNEQVLNESEKEAIVKQNVLNILGQSHHGSNKKPTNLPTNSVAPGTITSAPTNNINNNNGSTMSSVSGVMNSGINQIINTQNKKPRSPRPKNQGGTGSLPNKQMNIDSQGTANRQDCKTEMQTASDNLNAAKLKPGFAGTATVMPMKNPQKSQLSIEINDNDVDMKSTQHLTPQQQQLQSTQQSTQHVNLQTTNQMIQMPQNTTSTNQIGLLIQQQQQQQLRQPQHQFIPLQQQHQWPQPQTATTMLSPQQQQMFTLSCTNNGPGNISHLAPHQANNYYRWINQQLRSNAIGNPLMLNAQNSNQSLSGAATGIMQANLNPLLTSSPNVISQQHQQQQQLLQQQQISPNTNNKLMTPTQALTIRSAPMKHSPQISPHNIRMPVNNYYSMLPQHPNQQQPLPPQHMNNCIPASPHHHLQQQRHQMILQQAPPPPQHHLALQHRPSHLVGHAQQPPPQQHQQSPYVQASPNSLSSGPPSSSSHFNSTNPLILRLPQYKGYDGLTNGINRENCLIGCVFYLNGYDAISNNKKDNWLSAIRNHGGETLSSYNSALVTHLITDCQLIDPDLFKLALKNKTRIVTIYWVNDVIDKGFLEPPFEIIHLPSPFMKDLTFSYIKRQIVSITGFEGEERKKVEHMVIQLGVKYTEYFESSNTVLICKKSSGRKFEAAQKLGIACVNIRWLQDIYFGDLQTLSADIDNKYQCFEPNDVSIRLERMSHRVQELMVGWITPIRIDENSWKKYCYLKDQNEMDKQNRKRQAENSALQSNQDAKKTRWSLPSLTEEERQLALTCPIMKQNNTATLAAGSSHLSADTEDELLARDEAACNVVVAFTGLAPEQRDRLTDLVASLGGRITEEVTGSTSGGRCSHLIASQIVRTAKFYHAVLLGLPILSPKWLQASGIRQQFLDESHWLLNDTETEQSLGFKLSESLELSRARIQGNCSLLPLFHNLEFFISPRAKHRAICMDLIRRAGGILRDKRPIQRLALLSPEPQHILICHEDDAHLAQYLTRTKHGNRAVHHEEFVLSAVLKQQLDFNSYQIQYIQTSPAPSTSPTSKPIPTTSSSSLIVTYKSDVPNNTSGLTATMSVIKSEATINEQNNNKPQINTTQPRTTTQQAELRLNTTLNNNNYTHPNYISQSPASHTLISTALPNQQQQNSQPIFTQHQPTALLLQQHNYPTTTLSIQQYPNTIQQQYATTMIPQHQNLTTLPTQPQQIQYHANLPIQQQYPTTLSNQQHYPTTLAPQQQYHQHLTTNTQQYPTAIALQQQYPTTLQTQQLYSTTQQSQQQYSITQQSQQQYSTTPQYPSNYLLQESYPTTMSTQPSTTYISQATTQQPQSTLLSQALDNDFPIISSNNNIIATSNNFTESNISSASHDSPKSIFNRVTESVSPPLTTTPTTTLNTTIAATTTSISQCDNVTSHTISCTTRPTATSNCIYEDSIDSLIQATCPSTNYSEMKEESKEADQAVDQSEVDISMEEDQNLADGNDKECLLEESTYENSGKISDCNLEDKNQKNSPEEPITTGVVNETNNEESHQEDIAAAVDVNQIITESSVAITNEQKDNIDSNLQPNVISTDLEHTPTPTNQICPITDSDSTMDQ